jgi:hypothetical protein
MFFGGGSQKSSLEVDMPPAEKWKRKKRPLIYVLSADLSPSIQKRIETEGYEKGFNTLTVATIEEIF